MRVGDKDGLDNVYNEEGELILMEDEEMLVKEENIVPSLKTTWRKFGGEDVIDSMSGTFYLTNRRFVFIAKPENIARVGAKGAEGPKSFAVPIETPGSLKGIAKQKLSLDYFELLVKELLACEVSSGVVSSGEQVQAYIMASGEQYQLKFLGKEDSELLKRFKKNIVENVDELVANLKKYYENSDWIFG